MDSETGRFDDGEAAGEGVDAVLDDVGLARPNDPDGFLNAIDALRDLGRLDAADRFALEAADRYPDHLGIREQTLLLAIERGDPHEAAARGDRVRARLPGAPSGWRYGLLALRLAERIEDAELLGHIAIDLFGGDPDIGVEHILLAVHRADWGDTARRSEMMRRRFRDHPDGYRFGVMAARESGNLDLAEAIGDAASAAGVFSADVSHERALTALFRGEMADAAARWAEMRTTFPDDDRPLQIGVAALHEAGDADAAYALLRSAPNLPAPDADMARALATAATEQSDWAEAASHWEMLRVLQPDAVDGYRFGAMTLREAGRIADAEAVASLGTARFPNAPEMRAEQVLTRLAAGDPRAAADLAAEMRADFPGDPTGARLGIAALRESNDLQAADDLGAEMLSRFPSDLPLWREHAATASLRNEHDEAARRWLEVRNAFPDSPEGYAGLVSALREASGIEDAERRLRAADQVATAAMRRFPDDWSVCVAHAMNATTLRDWSEAARRWNDLRERFPGHPEPASLAVRALRNAGRVLEAEAVAAEGLLRFPDHAGIWIEGAFNALERNDLSGAARQWESVRTRFPNIPDGYTFGIQTLRDAGRFDEAEIVGRAAIARFPEAADPLLFEQFESLGDNCEFGLVQRHFGADPAGPLRWASITTTELIRAVAQGFEGLGEPGTLALVQDESGALMFEDAAYGLRVHTFAAAQTMDPETLLAAGHRRLAAGRERLLATLAKGERILVLKRSDARLSDDEIDDALAAIRRHGACPLLCVRTADDEHSDGQVEMRSEGLLIGHVARLSATADVNEILFQSWRVLCRNALEARDDHMALAASP